MKFYDRTKELTEIKRLITITQNKGSRVIVITGRRRIGKTRLALESVKETKHIYLFTKKKKMHDLIQEWSAEVKKTLGEVFYGQFTDFDQFFEFLFSFSRTTPFIVIIDEVQNLLSVDPTSFGTIQKLYDLHRETSRLCVIFLGSSYSLMNRIFTNEKEPMFGRASDIIKLSYLPLKAQKEILKDTSLLTGHNLLHAFSLFDGVPKYLEEFVDMEAHGFIEKFKALLIEREFLWEEGEYLLKEEFGKEYNSYYSILSAIAKGRCAMNEIEQHTGIKEVGAYLANLEETYSLIERKLPITRRSTKERNGRYYLRDNFLHFWFHFIDAKRSLKEVGRIDKALDEILNELPTFEGRKLEDMLIRTMIEENPLSLEFTKAGKYWDRQGTIELDAVFIDEDTKRVYIFEVKTNKKKILKKQLEILHAKALSLQEFNNYSITLGIAYLDKDDLQVELCR